MNILFLCTANSCRSILCEALFNHLAPSSMRAYSAGSQPKGSVHPLALKTLEKAGISIAGLYSKSSDVHAELAPDIVITVCDKAAGEACPIFLSQAIKAHWGLADPSEQIDSAENVDAAFERTLAIIRQRVEAFLVLPCAAMTSAQLAAELARIGSLEPQRSQRSNPRCISDE